MKPMAMVLPVVVATLGMGSASPAQTPCTALGDGYATAFQVPLTVPAPGVLANDTGCGPNPMAAGPETAPSHGGLMLKPDGGFVYTPAPGFVGGDSFTYRVLGATGLSNPATVVIAVNPPHLLRPLPPTNLYTYSVTDGIVTLRWTPPAFGPRPTDYELLGGIDYPEVLAVIPTGGTDPIFTLAVPTGTFYVRVRSVAGTVRSDPSEAIRLYVGVPVPPSAPDGLTSVVNGSTVNLAWRNTFGGGAPGTIFLEVLSPSGTSLFQLGLTETLGVAGVPPGTYELRVWAVNASGVSGPSNQVAVTVPAACTGPPQMPGNFLVYSSGSTVQVIWDAPAAGPAATGYEVIVGGAMVGRFPTSDRRLGGVVAPGDYQVSVLATNACGSSPATPARGITVP